MAATIKDIAERSGVCRATVSRVINNSGYVGKDTRERILQVIKQMDYTPSANARGLSNHRTATVAVVIPDITNPFFCDVISGITQILNQEQYDLIFFDSNEDGDREKAALDTVAGYMVSGVIFCPQSDLPQGLARLRPILEDKTPLVLLDREISGLSCSGVFTDNCRGAKDAVRALINAGHERIAVIHGPVDTLPGRERLRGYREAMAEAGLFCPDSYIKQGDFMQESAAGLTKELMSLNVPPTAIFSCNNLMSIGCVQALNDLGLSIPEDVAFAGFDELDRYGVLGGGLTVVSRDNTEMGREAARLLLERINDPDAPPRRIIVQPALTVCGSERFISRDGTI